MLARVLLMADDLGRLRRAGVENYALERLGNSLETLDAMLRPSAGQLYRRGWSVREALAVVDGERADLRRRLCVEPR
jgi:hypothetical protein